MRQLSSPLKFALTLARTLLKLLKKFSASLARCPMASLTFLWNLLGRYLTEKPSIVRRGANSGSPFRSAFDSKTEYMEYMEDLKDLSLTSSDPSYAASRVPSRGLQSSFTTPGDISNPYTLEDGRTSAIEIHVIEPSDTTTPTHAPLHTVAQTSSPRQTSETLNLPVLSILTAADSVGDIAALSQETLANINSKISPITPRVFNRYGKNIVMCVTSLLFIPIPILTIILRQRQYRDQMCDRSSENVFRRVSLFDRIPRVKYQ